MLRLVNDDHHPLGRSYRGQMRKTVIQARAQHGNIAMRNGNAAGLQHPLLNEIALAHGPVVGDAPDHHRDRRRDDRRQ
eukprot:8394-Eustigmatos_ZCMA.PRE.1